MNEISIYKSVWNGVKVLAGCLFFVLIGIDLITGDPEDRWSGWLSVSFFGMGIPVGLFLIFDRRPALIISEEGITIKAWKKTFIAWQHIDEASARNTRFAKMICLYVKEGNSPHADKNAFTKIMQGWSKNLGHGDISIQVSNLQVNPDRLLNLVVAMINASGQARKELMEDLAAEGAI